MDHKQLMKNRIFNYLDKIEELTGVMIEDNEYLADLLKLWQDNKVKDLYFLNTLAEYIDQLQGDFHNGQTN